MRYSCHRLPTAKRSLLILVFIIHTFLLRDGKRDGNIPSGRSGRSHSSLGCSDCIGSHTLPLQEGHIKTAHFLITHLLQIIYVLLFRLSLVSLILSTPVLSTFSWELSRQKGNDAQWLAHTSDSTDSIIDLWEI